MIRTLLIELATVLAYAAWSANVAPVVVEDRVDLIIVNHFHDEQCRHVFDQVIFADLAPDGVYDVVAWRLLKSPAQWPQRRNGRWEAVWLDDDHTRRVFAKVMREEWTQFDPELVARERLPKEQRRGLATGKVKQ